MRNTSTNNLGQSVALAVVLALSSVTVILLMTMASANF